MNRSAQKEDNQTSEIIQKIIQVPKNIQVKALKYFLNKTAELCSLAFFQWRYRFPTMYTNEEELVEILEERLDLLFDPIRSASSDDVPNFFHHRPLPKTFYKSYKSLFDQPESENFTIHSFA